MLEKWFQSGFVSGWIYESDLKVILVFAGKVISKWVCKWVNLWKWFKSDLSFWGFSLFQQMPESSVCLCLLLHNFDLLNLCKFGIGDLKHLLLRHLFKLAVRRIGSIRKARGGLFGIVFFFRFHRVCPSNSEWSTRWVRWVKVIRMIWQIWVALGS